MKYLKFLVISMLLTATLPSAGGELTLEQAAAIAKEQTGGRVLDARVGEIDGRKMHIIKILDAKGHVRSLAFDPKQP